MNDAIEVQLSVSVAKREITAQLLFHNRSSKDFLIDPSNTMADGRMTKRLFDIRRIDGEPVRYTGITIKKEALKPEKFVTIPKGGEVASQVRLDKFYDWPTGAGQFNIVYSAYNPATPESELTKLVSAPVIFYLKEEK